MKKEYILLLLSVFVLIRGVDAQVQVDSKLNRAEIVIGEQAVLTTTVSANANQSVKFPEYKSSDTIVKGLEVLECGVVDSTFVNNGKRVTLRRDYLITSFDSALYSIPQMEIEVDGHIYSSRSRLGLKVVTVPVDTTNVNDFNGAYNVMPIHFEWEWSLVLLCLPLWFFVVLLLVLAVRLSRRKPTMRRVVIQPPVPPFKKAKLAMEQIRNDAGCNDDISNKKFFMALTAVLKTYLSERFGFNAVEMTTGEIENEVTAYIDETAQRRLKGVLRIADFVKFAKQTATNEERRMCYDDVLTLMNDTRDEVMESPQPVVKMVEYSDTHQHRIRIALWICTGVTFLSCSLWFARCVYKIWKTYL